MSLVIPFVTQVALAGLAFIVGRQIASRAGKQTGLIIAGLALALLFAWPAARFFPVPTIDLLGAPLVACLELTGLAIPAVLFFTIAAKHVPKRTDQRAILLLNAVAVLYFVRAGWWMVAPGVPNLGVTRMDDMGVCRQSTSYTCVGASMVTMLAAHDIPAEETEMARLAYTQVNGGATDSRALWALERKLAGTGLKPCYEQLDMRGLIDAPKPCMVQLNWGYFMSHMVPVMHATEGNVVIGDPLSGIREMPMDQFLRTWKRTAIMLKKAT